MLGRSGLSRWALVFALLWVPAAALAAPDRAAKEAELERLKGRIVELRRELDAVRGHFDGVRAELREVERRIGAVTRELHRLDGRMREQVLKLEGLERRKRELDGTVAVQRERLAAQVRAAYASGRQEFVKILLNQQEPAAVGRMLTYYDYLNRERSERIGQLLTSLSELERVRSAIAEETRELEGLRRQQAREKEQLDASHAERGRVLATLKDEIRSKDDRLQQMVRDEQELEALIKALAEALADIPPEAGSFKPFAKLRGTLDWPASGRRIAGFGSRRGSTDLRWQGVLIESAPGSPVRAVARGRVAFADWLRGYGLLIIVDHDDGYMSLYGHNESLYKETGDWVESGEVLASVGSSGGQERAGLYFEIRHNGRPRDPVRWCRR